MARAYAADEDTLRAALSSKTSAERLAAAYVVGERQLPWTSELIDRLTDTNTLVRQAARRSLVILSYFALLESEPVNLSSADNTPRKNVIVDFGPKPTADATAREQAVTQWKDWWDQHGNRIRSTRSGLETNRADAKLDADAARLGSALVFAPPEQQKGLLSRYQEQKGIVYTEAMANALSQLDGEILTKAREALAERLTRMTTTTLRARLVDPRAELRRAAALAWAMKDDRSAVPELIPLLLDPEELVVRATKAALKSLTGEDFGPGRGASSTERGAAVAAWKSWWNKQN
jgi:hypothetical protein